MKLIITTCTHRETVRNNIKTAFTNNTTIGEAEKIIRVIAHLVLNGKLNEAENILTQKTTFNKLQARTAIEIIRTDFEQAE